jgi:ABC-type uncharacterized transport system fused permease/ATPase subunit
LIVITVLQLPVQYRLNLWNRDFFNALEFRNGSEIWHQTHLLVLFAAISIGNTLLAPLVGLILSVPHHVQGTMLLGEVTQAAAAFVAVQGAFNWLIDNVPRLAECLSSANRVGNLLMAFDRLETQEGSQDYDGAEERQTA